MTAPIFPAALVEALGWALVHSLWQFALLALLCGALLRLASQRLAKPVQYWIAAGLLVGCGLLFGATTARHYLALQPPSARAAAPLAARRATPESAAIPEAPPPATISASWAAYLTPYLPSLAFVWLLGILFLSMRQAAQSLQLRQYRRRGVRAPARWLQAHWEALQAKIPLRREAVLLESSLVSGLATFGYLKPIVLTPVGLLASLPPEQVEALLLHELAHLRRNDYLHNLLLSSLEILFFFHPGIWWLARQVKRLREECCDELVLYAGADSLAYAEALLAAARFSSPPKISLMMNAHAHFAGRVARLLSAPPAQPSRAAAPVWLAAAFLLAAILLVIAAPALRAQPPIGSTTDRAEVHNDTFPPPKAAPQEIKAVTDPVASLGGYTIGGKVPLEDFKKYTRLGVLSPERFERPCEIIGYEITFVTLPDDPVSVSMQGADFSAAALKQIQQAVPGKTIVYIDQVMCRCPGDAEDRPINSLVLQVD